MKQRQIDGNERHRRLAWNFFRKQQAVKEQQKELEELKAEFEPQMEEYFSELGAKRVVFEGDQFEGAGNLIVRMVERTSIEWNAEKLEKRIPKEVARQVIKKRYQIDNMPGLIEYLKYCGVDPKIFKQFIRAEKFVDQKEVDRLSDLGLISVRNISGCYYVKCQKPYFTFSVKKDNDDEE